LGGAAAFFHVSPKVAVLSDANEELIACYEAIKVDYLKVLRYLRGHARKHSTNYYYSLRDKKLSCPFRSAAQFIYLNRACWNGLYRVNRNGIFNVPKGTKDTIIFPYDDFAGVASALGRAVLKVCDFEKTIDTAGSGDLIFADPPYTVRHNMNGFVKYNKSLFSWDDQARLHDCLIRASNRGAKIVISNADHPSIHELYSDFGSIWSLDRHTVIAGAASARSRTTEVIITNVVA
jgi:DNA adenine methylase